MNGQPQAKNGKTSPSKNGQRYEKRDKQSTYPQGGNKKKSGSTEQKKYVSKEKKAAKEESPKKAEWRLKIASKRWSRPPEGMLSVSFLTMLKLLPAWITNI